MTAIAIPGKRSGLLSPLVPSAGVGQDATTVASRIEVVREHFWQALTLRHLTESAWIELADVANSAAQSNWDGYGARPVDGQAFLHAERFLNALPTTTPVPDVSVDPDGEISVSWNLAPDWVFSVSVGPTGRLSYAGVFGSGTAYGTEWFVNDIPAPILDSLTRVFSGRTKHAA